MPYVAAAAGLVALVVGFAIGDPIVVVLSAATVLVGCRIIAKRRS